MWTYNYSDELCHYGVLGMKWGVRKAKASYIRANQEYKSVKNAMSKYTSKMDSRASKYPGNNKHLVGEANFAKRISTAYTNAMGKKASKRKATYLAKKKAYKKATSSHEDYRKVHDGKSVRNMSDSELKSRNNRLQMERQYNTLTKKTSKGKKVLASVIGVAGTISAVEGAYKVYKKWGDRAISAIGNVVMKKNPIGFKA